MLRSAYDYTYNCYKTGTDLFHRNVRLILNLCFPSSNFDEQMRRAWITDSILCSAPVEGGAVPSRVAKACRSRYLEAQLELLPNAVIAALGGKAANRSPMP
jgi:uracil-DNA glycosylase